MKNPTKKDVEALKKKYTQQQVNVMLEMNDKSSEALIQLYKDEMLYYSFRTEMYKQALKKMIQETRPWYVRLLKWFGHPKG